jgi:hypothetical protein
LIQTSVEMKMAEQSPPGFERNESGRNRGNADPKARGHCQKHVRHATA